MHWMNTAVLFIGILGPACSDNSHLESRPGKTINGVYRADKSLPKITVIDPQLRPGGTALSGRSKSILGPAMVLLTRLWTMGKTTISTQNNRCSCAEHHCMDRIKVFGMDTGTPFMMPRTQITARLLFCSLSFLTYLAVTVPSAGANDASYWGEGATVFAYKEHRIRMASEHIRIRYEPDERFPNAGWVADCTFEFENLEDSPLTIQMGFPDRGAFPMGLWTIRAFEVEVNGESVSATHKTVRDPRKRRSPRAGRRRPAKAEPVPQPEPALERWRAMAKETMKNMNIRFGAAYTWPVNFAAKGQVIVKNRYRFGGGSTNGPISVCLEGQTIPATGGFWYDPESRHGFGSGPCSEVAYIVTSGRTWHGPIGKAIIEIELPPTAAPNHVIPMPAATSISARAVKWHFTDFVPKTEVKVVFATSMHFTEDRDGAFIDFSTVGEVRDWLAFGVVNGFRPDLIEKMYELQAHSFGLRRPGVNVASFFNAFTRPKTKSVKTINELTNEEKKILKLLSIQGSAQ